MRRLALVLCLVLAACAGLAGERPWARDRSDLPHDPAVKLGVLPNGMRYLLRPNASPPGQVAMRLVIHAGSMHETPGTEGAAHFLEHMLFRGTKRYPDGEMQRALQNLGATLGVDANASTAPDVTIYKINLPRNDANAVFEGLLILRDMMGEAMLDPALLEVERRVVLAEERARHGPSADREELLLRARLGDHPYARPPIGELAAIEAMDATALRAFYDIWYRPDRATLVIVGDMKPEEVEPVLRGMFADWKGHGPRGHDPPPAAPHTIDPQTHVAVIPGVADAELILQWTSPYQREAPTLETQRRRLVDQLGAIAVGQRMTGLLEEAGRPARAVTGPQADRIENVWSGAMMRATGVTDAARTLEVMTAAARQAGEFGVSQQELDSARTIRLSSARSTGARPGASASANLAEMIARSLIADPVFISPSDNLRVTRDLAATITLDEVNAALRHRLQTAPALFYIADAAPAGGDAMLRETLASAWAAPVAAYAAVEVKAWPYSTFGAPGEVIERREVEDLGLTFVTFANGVTLSVKRTNFNRQELRVRVSLGRGRLGLSREGPDAGAMSAGVWQTGGLGQLTATEQARALAGQFALAGVELGEDAFELSTVGGVALASGLGVQIELMAAMTADPGLRADAWAQLLADADRAEASARLTPAGVLALELPRLLHDGDGRWAISTPAMRRTWSPQAAADVVRREIARAPADVTVVGDVDVEAVVAHVARTFGAAPVRAAAPEPKGMRDVTFPAGVSEPVVLHHGGRSDQGMVVIAWPTHQGLMRNPREARIGEVLGDLLRDRATLRFRNGEGATYAPVSEVKFSSVLPDYGYLQVAVDLPPERMDAALREIDAIAAELAATPVLDEELQRTLGPRVASLRRDRESSNAWWMDQLDGAHADPARLDAIRSGIADYQSITAADVMAAAKRWLRPGAALRVKVVAG